MRIQVSNQLGSPASGDTNKLSLELNTKVSNQLGSPASGDIFEIGEKDSAVF